MSDEAIKKKVFDVQGKYIYSFSIEVEAETEDEAMKYVELLSLGGLENASDRFNEELEFEDVYELK